MPKLSISIWLLLTTIVATVPRVSQALTVDSFDCSGIDVTDGNTDDWENIPYLIQTDESVTGTTYYLADDNSWTTTESEDWRYSMNLEQQANIQEMKICNTDTFFLLLNTQQPMMSVYDLKQDGYVDLWTAYDTTADEEDTYFTLPADYHYWMVWAMQAADGTGSIMYLAADLAMDAGDVQDVQVPKLYLFKDSDLTATFDSAEFDPTEDTELTTIELSDDDPCDVPADEAPETCEPDVIDRNDSAFEVSQNIAELFHYADFAFGDTINIVAAMYNSDTFGTVASSQTITAIDTTETGQYTFSDRPVRNLHPLKHSLGTSTITLKWKPLVKAHRYQLKLINPKNDKILRFIKNIEHPHYTLKKLDSGTDYRAAVRAVLRNSASDKTYSAWSSGYKWTTNE